MPEDGGGGRKEILRGGGVRSKQKYGLWGREGEREGRTL